MAHAFAKAQQQLPQVTSGLLYIKVLAAFLPLQEYGKTLTSGHRFRYVRSSEGGRRWQWGFKEIPYWYFT